MVLEREAEADDDAEQVGADEQKARAPEREDDQPDRNPPRTGGEPVRPARNELQRIDRASDASQHSPDDGVCVAIAGHVYSHGVGRRRVLSHCP